MAQAEARIWLSLYYMHLRRRVPLVGRALHSRSPPAVHEEGTTYKVVSTCIKKQLKPRPESGCDCLACISGGECLSLDMLTTLASHLTRPTDNPGAKRWFL